MLRTALLPLLILAVAPARADECDVLAARIASASASGLVIARGKPPIFNVRHPLGLDGYATCAESRIDERSISITAKGRFPIGEFEILMISIGGPWLAVDETSVLEVLRLCLTRANTGLGYAETSRLRASCTGAEASTPLGLTVRRQRP